MKIFKPKFWEKINLISIFLYPASLILQLLIATKKIFISQNSFKIPIICIGNIYLGGTGKTPLSILITRELIKKKKKPAIIKKFYKAHIDEHKLINNSLNCLFLNNTRLKSIKAAERKHYNVAILDDGFQDISIKKDLNILCFNSNQLIGNGLTIPAGPLRESVSAIKKAQIIVINGNKDKLFEKRILTVSEKIKIFYSRYLPTNINQFKKKKILAFAGIGNPNNFFNLLRDNNLNVQKKVAFPDHYEFSKVEIQDMIATSREKNLELVTTEKDYFRIKKFGLKNIKYVKLKLHILKKEKLLSHILSYL